MDLSVVEQVSSRLPLSEPKDSRVGSLGFLGLCLARKGTRGDPDSATFQESFDLDLLQDRDCKYVCSTNDGGWLAGGGEPGVKDSAHVEIMHIGNYAEDGHNITENFIVECLRSGEILIPEITVVPTGVVANGNGAPVEVRFDMIPPIPDFYNCTASLPLNWQLRFLKNQLLRKFNCARRFDQAAFRSTIVRQAEFRSDTIRASYLNKCEAQCSKWIGRGAQPLAPPRDGVSPCVEVVRCQLKEPKSLSIEGSVSEIDENDGPLDYYRSGLWLFKDSKNISHQFLPNFLPPYDTPNKKKIILQILSEEWDERLAMWKSLTSRFDPPIHPIPQLFKSLESNLAFLTDSMCFPFSEAAETIREMEALPIMGFQQKKTCPDTVVKKVEKPGDDVAVDCDTSGEGSKVAISDDAYTNFVLSLESLVSSRNQQPELEIRFDIVEPSSYFNAPQKLFSNLKLLRLEDSSRAPHQGEELQRKETGNANLDAWKLITFRLSPLLERDPIPRGVESSLPVEAPPKTVEACASFLVQIDDGQEKGLIDSLVSENNVRIVQEKGLIDSLVAGDDVRVDGKKNENRSDDGFMLGAGCTNLVTSLGPVESFAPLMRTEFLKKGLVYTQTWYNDVVICQKQEAGSVDGAFSQQGFRPFVDYLQAKLAAITDAVVCMPLNQDMTNLLISRWSDVLKNEEREFSIRSPFLGESDSKEKAVSKDSDEGKKQESDSVLMEEHAHIVTSSGKTETSITHDKTSFSDGIVMDNEKQADSCQFFTSGEGHADFFTSLGANLCRPLTAEIDDTQTNGAPGQLNDKSPLIGNGNHNDNGFVYSDISGEELIAKSAASPDFDRTDPTMTGCAALASNESDISALPEVDTNLKKGHRNSRFHHTRAFTDEDSIDSGISSKVLLAEMVVLSYQLDIIITPDAGENHNTFSERGDAAAVASLEANETSMALDLCSRTAIEVVTPAMATSGLFDSQLDHQNISEDENDDDNVSVDSGISGKGLLAEMMFAFDRHYAVSSDDLGENHADDLGENHDAAAAAAAVAALTTPLEVSAADTTNAPEASATNEASTYAATTWQETDPISLTDPGDSQIDHDHVSTGSEFTGDLAMVPPIVGVSLVANDSSIQIDRYIPSLHEIDEGKIDSSTDGNSVEHKELKEVSVDSIVLNEEGLSEMLSRFP